MPKKSSNKFVLVNLVNFSFVLRVPASHVRRLDGWTRWMADKRERMEGERAGGWVGEWVGPWDAMIHGILDGTAHKHTHTHTTQPPTQQQRTHTHPPTPARPPNPPPPTPRARARTRMPARRPARAHARADAGPHARPHARAPSGMACGRMAPIAGDAGHAGDARNTGASESWQRSRVAAYLQCFEPSLSSSSSGRAGGDDAPKALGMQTMQGASLGRQSPRAAAQCRRPPVGLERYTLGFAVSQAACRGVSASCLTKQFCAGV